MFCRLVLFFLYKVSNNTHMRLFKRLILSLSLLSLIFVNPGLSSAALPPSLISGAIDEPIVSSDGNDIQVAHVVVSVPGKISDLKGITIMIVSPDAPDHAFGVFTWSPVSGFSEQTGLRDGSEYVNLIPTDVDNPDTSSQAIPNPAAREIELIYRWTLNRNYGSTFGNDMKVFLQTRAPYAWQRFLLQSAYAADKAEDVLEVDADFDTNSPPEFVEVEDVEVVADGEVPVEKIIEAIDIDSDPITYVMISAPAEATFVGEIFNWLPTVEDIGTENIQFVATDPYGTTTLDFDIVVAETPIPEDGAWTTMSTTGAPDGRSGHSLVWADDQAIAWGGATLLDGIVGTGGSYNLVNNTWTATTSALDGFASSNHSAVWTGDEMLVWGGLTASGVTNAGQLYSPATQVWRAMSTDGAPSARYDAASVWTGDEFVVWGGVNIADGVSTWLNDGGRYNPSTDTWQVLSASDLTGRQAPAATWINDQMLIWGGSSWSAETGNVYYNTGALYNPSKDTWTLMSTVNAPTGRVAHSLASVVNDTIVVWGGANASGYLETGGVYDLNADTWTDTSLVDAPDARMGAVSGGSKGTLVVWGGNGADGQLSTGGIYAQGADTWLATLSVGMPSARQLATGVWTETSLLLWGGLSAGGVPENTGGIFTP